MSILPDSPEPPTTATRPLVERVQELVTAAETRLTASPRGPAPLQALHRVFRDMGRAQRTARRRTGEAPSPIVRQAALAFRQAPSLSALVLVAASLDEIGLLS